MFELYITILLAAFVWAKPLYRLIKKKETLNQSTILLAPIAYFAFYLMMTNLPVNNDMFIYEGFQDRLIQYFLIMHIIIFVIVSVFEPKAKR